MALNFVEHYQVGRQEGLIFEDELRSVSGILGRPFPEFRGAQLHEHPEGEMKWLVEACVRGKMVPPRSEVIQFQVVENTWVHGLARAMQETLA